MLELWQRGNDIHPAQLSNLERTEGMRLDLCNFQFKKGKIHMFSGNRMTNNPEHLGPVTLCGLAVGGVYSEWKDTGKNVSCKRCLRVAISLFRRALMRPDPYPCKDAYNLSFTQQDYEWRRLNERTG